MGVVEADQPLVVEAGAEVDLEAVELVEVEDVLVGAEAALLADDVDEFGVLDHLEVFGCELLVYFEFVAQSEGVVGTLTELLDDVAAHRVT